MTGPLIDRDTLARVICGDPDDPDAWKYDARTVRTTAMVMHYLREVLTPGALIPTETVPHGEYVIKRLASGGDMRRRILGDDT